MSSNQCNINTLLLVAIVVLCIGYTDSILQALPIIKKLFTDQINYILMIILVMFILLIDMPTGIILTFLVLYLSVYINHINNKKKVSFANVPNTIDYKLGTGLNSESEFIYNNTKPFPNLNNAPFRPSDMNMTEDLAKVVLPSFPIKDNNDFITSVGPPDREGYDVSGCRYDFKNSPQNFTKFGPPLSQCGAYSGSQAQMCGTLFYPLNA